ncbi:hypothetical protein [Virgibacillus sp. YIM 98842]|uniref:hypothetical protein n=1 Tax=Virgibacillus sp. YIM 98842 TaxID=2663533 RepID=UPI001969CF85|nr:hypothetical protein [Virgibacillus sp. YIM 98842]
MNYQITWSTNWIQEYESPWGILEKFKWANAVDGNTVLALIGNENVKQLKSISNAGSRHRNLIYFSSIDSKKTKKIIGLDLKVYHDNLVKKLLHIIPNLKHEGNYFHSSLSYCPSCLSIGYHSILHQIKLFDHCAFHPNQKLNDRCVKCNQLMPEYLINKGNQEAFRCTCGYDFLDSENIRLIFSSWQKQPKIQNKIIKSWLKLSRNKIHEYYLVYPFDNYKKILEVDKSDKDYLRHIPKLIINAFNKGTVNREVIKISSRSDIFNIRNDDQQLKENYKEIFPHLFSFSSYKFNEKHRLDSIYFAVYKQTRIIYKAITRYILRRVIKEHSKCVKIFNKARQNGDVCPHAFAFVLWKMECEGIDALWKIENHNKLSETYEFICLNERFSIFLNGAFMTHLVEILNPISSKDGFNFMDCNISSLKYILDKILSHLLIERYIKWLEVVQNPDKYKHTYPDDCIPMYICKIPQKLSGEISFYIPENRIDYMKNIIQDIGDEFSCPFNWRVKYPPYKSPIRIAMDKMSY